MEEKNKNESITPPEENGDVLEKGTERSEKKGKKRSQVIGTFLLSLLASVVLWIVAVDYEVTDYEKTFTDIAVIVKGRTELLGNKGMEVTFDNSFRLDITVSGKRSQISTLDSSSFVAFVDVSNISTEGKTSLKLEVEPVNGVSVVGQSMAYLVVDAEKRITDTFDIDFQMGTVQLDKGVDYTLIGDTAQVSVTGSESIIKNIKKAAVLVNPDPKYVTESFESRCKIVLQSDIEIDEEAITISPAYCDVKVVLTKEKNVPLKLKVSGGADIDYNSSLEMSKNKLIISGEPKIVDSIEYLEVEVDYEKIKNHLGSSETSFDISGEIIYPDGISSVDGETEITVMVNVEERIITLSGRRVLLTGIPEGYTAKAEDVNIELVGLEEEIDDIVKSDSFSLTADLTGTEPTSTKKIKCSVSISNPMGVIYDDFSYVVIEFRSTSSEYSLE